MSLNKINISEKKDRDGNIIKQFTMNEYIPCSDEEKAIYGVEKKLNNESVIYTIRNIKSHDNYDLFMVNSSQYWVVLCNPYFLKEENAIKWITEELEKNINKNKKNNESK